MDLIQSHIIWTLYRQIIDVERPVNHAVCIRVKPLCRHHTGIMSKWYGCYGDCVDITRTLNPRRTRVGRHGRRQLCWRVVTGVVLATLFWCLFLLRATLAVLEKPYMACLSSSACRMDKIWSRDQRRIPPYKSDQSMNQSVNQSVSQSCIVLWEVGLGIMVCPFCVKRCH